LDEPNNTDERVQAEAQRLSDEMQGRIAIENTHQSGASWFYWLAALSLINSIIAAAGGAWSFLFGLGATQLVDAMVLYSADEGGDVLAVAKAIGLVVNIGIAGMFVLFGWLAKRRNTVVFILGMALYGLDSFLLLWAEDFLGVAFHVWVLFSLVRGLKACRLLNSMDRAASAGTFA
jgi:hypothetical protein